MEWKVDLAHSSLEFAVRHMIVSTVKGAFSEFSVEPEIYGDDIARPPARWR